MIRPEETKYDFYLAGPFFDELQINMQEKIELLMDVNEKMYFSPRRDAGTLGKNPSVEDMQKVFNADLDAIKQCKYLFANISFKDTGTSVEIGYALSRNIPIVLFWNEHIHDSDHINLMIASACGGKYISNWQQLGEYLETGILPDNKLKFEVE